MGDGERIMLEICKHPHWIFHNSKKQPTNHRGQIINALDPKNHLSFEDAYELYGNSKVAGMGFVFMGTGFVGVDLDKCINHYSVKHVANIATLLDSYTELSPSGDGLHTIIKDSQMIPHSIKKHQIEIYAEKRFFTVTFESIHHPPKKIEERHDELMALMAILQDQKLYTLWVGATNGFKSHSEADMSFVRRLLNVGASPELVERIFVLSGLHREKNETKRGELTYLQHTIKKALET